jgi:hypothetical protein
VALNLSQLQPVLGTKTMTESTALGLLLLVTTGPMMMPLLVPVAIGAMRCVRPYLPFMLVWCARKAIWAVLKRLIAGSLG